MPCSHHHLSAEHSCTVLGRGWCSAAATHLSMAVTKYSPSYAYIRYMHPLRSRSAAARHTRTGVRSSMLILSA